jgi:hypothetical protein
MQVIGQIGQGLRVGHGVSNLEITVDLKECFGQMVGTKGRELDSKGLDFVM